MNCTNNVTVKRITHLDVCEKWLHAPGSSEYYRLFCTLRGNLRLWTAVGTVTVSAGECVFLSPITRIRSCHSEDVGVDFFEISFDLSGTPKFNPLTLYSADNDACALLSLLKSESTDIYKNKLLEIFIDLAVTNPAQKCKELLITDAVCDYIDNNISKNFDVDTIAEALGYDRSHISRVFKQTTGQNLKTYISEKRVAYISDLLEFSDYTINKIAAMTGFDNSNLFTKYFIYHTGLTPSDYRRKLHGIPTVHVPNE